MIRARVVVLPLVLLGAPTGYLASLEVSDAREEREIRRIDREFEERLVPATEALRGIRLDGLSACPGLKPAEVACLRGTVAVEAAHAAVTRALRDAGATDVRPACRKTVSGRPVCTVTATLHRSDVTVMAGHEFLAGKPTATVRVTMTAFPQLPL